MHVADRVGRLAPHVLARVRVLEALARDAAAHVAALVLRRRARAPRERQPEGDDEQNRGRAQHLVSAL
eukprot:1651069-Prymnesium_polylepis.1